MHILQSKHTKVSEKEAESLLQEMNLAKNQLPRILLSDPALPEESEIGDVIKIIRKAEGEETLFYRVVV